MRDRDREKRTHTDRLISIPPLSGSEREGERERHEARVLTTDATGGDVMYEMIFVDTSVHQKKITCEINTGRSVSRAGRAAERGAEGTHEKRHQSANTASVCVVIE